MQRQPHPQYPELIQRYRIQRLFQALPSGDLRDRVFVSFHSLNICSRTHTSLSRPQSMEGHKKIRVEQHDIHVKLMHNYPEVPDWWYITSFVIFYCMMIMVIEASARVLPGRCVCAYPSAGMEYVGASLGIIVINYSACYIRSSFWHYFRHDGSRSEFFSSSARLSPDLCHRSR